MQLEHYQHTLIGKRKINADALGMCELSPDFYAFIVVDGSPDIAAAKELAQGFCDDLLEKLKILDLDLLGSYQSEQLQESIREISTRIFQGDKEILLKNSKLAFALCLLHQNFTVFVHIGDCRIYRIADGITFQSWDHSIGARIENSTNEEADVLTRVLAYNKVAEPDIVFQEPIAPNELIVLATDGFWRNIESLILTNLKMQGSLAEAFTALCKQIDILPLKDNLSFQLIQLQNKVAKIHE